MVLRGDKEINENEKAEKKRVTDEKAAKERKN